ncbi:MAG: hypothetical protein ACT4N9_00105 [Paracoccaceae bacterium]
MSVVLILGSAPNATQARDWPRAAFDRIVVINNAHRLRPDWDAHIFPWDFPSADLPPLAGGQVRIEEGEFVPAQNAYGGFVYGGGTMAFTAGYWALHALRPRVLAFMGCDMHYPANGQTHFYGTGTADPLRADITLRSLEAKSARLMLLAARQGCAAVNLSDGPSRLVLPRAGLTGLGRLRPAAHDPAACEAALSREAALGYVVPSGRYWQEAGRFDPAAIDALDALWLAASQERPNPLEHPQGGQAARGQA